jgi:polyhydroxyalkanoate synthesis regulator phasin
MGNDSKKDSSSAGSDPAKSDTNKISDAIKKIISSGSPTEISKEILSTVLNQALKAKDDVAAKVTNEMISLVRKIDFVQEFSKFAQNHKFKVTAEIEILKKDHDHKDIKKIES